MNSKKSNSRNSNSKKTNGIKSKRPSKKRRGIFKAKAIKPKVRLDSSKVIGLCAAIAIFCTILLLAAVFIPSDSAGKNDVAVKEIQKTEKTRQPAKKVPPKTTPKNDKKQPEIKPQKTDDTKLQEEQKKLERQKKELEQKQQEELKKQQLEAQKKQEEEKLRQQKMQEEAQNKLYADFPSAVNNAKLVFIFDDGGYNVSQLKKVLSLPFPITVAVLPKLAYSKQCGTLVRNSGNEVILHQPMQSVNLSVNPGPGAILPEMTVEEIRSILQENVREVGPVSGLNNHEGSLITEDETRIGAVLQAADELGIYFLDSRTTSQTRVMQAAMSMGYGYYQRDVFLDNEKTKENIVSEVKKGLGIANKKGCAIMIGHVWSADILPDVLAEMYPVLVKKGYKFCTVSKSGALIRP
ncbi:MAG: divergent polysaccharide deacetylase family protein [Treponema sp.]